MIRGCGRTEQYEHGYELTNQQILPWTVRTTFLLDDVQARPALRGYPETRLGKNHDLLDSWRMLHQ